MTRHGGGLVVSIFTFDSDDPSSNPSGFLNFLHDKTKISEKEARVLHIFKKTTTRHGNQMVCVDPIMTGF